MSEPSKATANVLDFLLNIERPWGYTGISLFDLFASPFG
jgi:hypothetical protein